ncbi:MAG: DUF5318 family protein [Actinomycetes bacterium]
MAPKIGMTTMTEASVEYRLLRDARARAVRLGKVAQEDVCDAHPELIRAATNLGRSTGDLCPVCEERSTVEVTYVFGAKLPPGGTCPSTKAELNRLLRRQEPVQAYAVEVCTACRFHHLLRRYPGGDQATSRPASRPKASRDPRGPTTTRSR